MHLLRSKAMVAALAVTASIGVTACGSSSKSSTTGSTKSTAAATTGTTSSSTSTSASTGSTPTVSANSFTNNFAAMAALKSLAAAGHGKIAAILPDTTSSTRYVEFDEPDLKKAMATAGLPSSDIVVQNGLGSDSTFLTDAESDITNGATVLLIDPEDSGTGTQVENYAKAHGVAVIDYDRLTLGGSRKYYISFNNVEVGTKIGQSLVSCVASEKVAHPQVVVMRGAPTDNNATLFAQGYDAVLKSYFASGKWKDVANPAGTWDPPTALTEFQGAYTAHPNINAALIPNDENGSPIINYLKSKGIKPNTFPTTGQDATLTGLQAILTGYQCGTVYKPVYKEAEAAVAVALYVRAGKTPPSSLVNGTTEDTTKHVAVASVLLTPEYVTTKNMNSTIIADNFVPASQLCAGTYASDCKKYGITP
jgi:D-xylose transport system substrate-binding protein